MNEWLIATVVLLAALVPCLAVCALADSSQGLPAFQLTGVLTTTALMTLAEGTQRQPFVDLAIVLAFLSLVGSLAFARLMTADI